MNDAKSTMAHRIAKAAIAFEQRRTGNHVPKSVTAVISEGTLVITLHEALSPAEKALAMTPEGAAQVQEFHRQLFAKFLRVITAGGPENQQAWKCARRLPKSSLRERACVVQAFTVDRHRGASLPPGGERTHGIVARKSTQPLDRHSTAPKGKPWTRIPPSEIPSATALQPWRLRSHLSSDSISSRSSSSILHAWPYLSPG